MKGFNKLWLSLTATPQPFFEADIVPDQTGFGEAVGATIGLRVAPIVDNLRQGFQYGATRDPNYDPLQDLGDYTIYAPSLVNAKNAAHMAEMKRGIDEGIARRQTLSNASTLTQIRCWDS